MEADPSENRVVATPREASAAEERGVRSERDARERVGVPYLLAVLWVVVCLALYASQLARIV